LWIRAYGETVLPVRAVRGQMPWASVAAAAAVVLSACSSAAHGPSVGRATSNRVPSTAVTSTVSRQPSVSADAVASPRCDDGGTTPVVTPPASPAVASVRVSYRQVGTGSHVVVLLHGGPGASEPQLLTDFAPISKDGLRVVYYDQRGVGRSPTPIDLDYSPDTYVADLEALRVRLGARCLDLIGGSWGGAVEALYTAVHPDRVRSLVEINGTPLADRPFYQGIANFQRRVKALQARHLVPNPLPAPDGDDCRAELTALAPVYAPDPTHAHAYIPTGSIPCSSTAANLTDTAMTTDDGRVQQLRRALAQWHGRALIIQGAQDPFGRPWTVANAAQYASAHVTTRVISHAGHMSWLDDPALIAHIAQYLQGR
jgi:pimeloyl-ACP methyl ester carboxylesterase